MLYVVSIGTYLPCWGTPQHGVAGDDEGAVTATVRAAKQAFAMAGTTPADVDVTEVHDFFTGVELISYEGLGFAERFGAYKLLEAEETTIGGGLPVNTSGGLKAKGHPPGRRVSHNVLKYWRSCAAKRSTRSTARESASPTTSGPTAVCAVAILEGPVTHGG
jgi:acetyl-CoA C-acetyltransferase